MILRLRKALSISARRDFRKHSIALIIALSAIVLTNTATGSAPRSKYPVVCLAVQADHEKLPRSIVFPIAHLEMNEDLEAKLRAVVGRFGNTPDVVFETKPTSSQKELSCTEKGLAAADPNLHREVIDLLTSSREFAQLGVHPGLIAGLPASVIYFLATAQCTGQLSHPQKISTEARVHNELKKRPKELEFLEDGETLSCLLQETPTQVLLEAAKSQLQSCADHDAALNEMFLGIERGVDNELLRTKYISTLHGIGHKFLSRVNFTERDKLMQQKIITASTRGGVPKLVFPGAFHLPSWLVDGGTSPDGLKVRNICR